MPVMELTVVPPSLIASFAMCECASMMPGDTNCPVVSITSAPDGIVDVRADSCNLAVAENDGAVRDGALRHGQHGAATQCNNSGLRRLGLSLNAGYRPQKEKRGGQKEA